MFRRSEEHLRRNQEFSQYSGSDKYISNYVLIESSALSAMNREP